MERCGQKFLLIGIVVLCALSTSHLVSSQQCNNYYYSERCTVQSLNINSSNLGSLKFPVHADIELSNVQMDYLSPEVTLRMKWVSKLTITNGKIGKIFLKQDLQNLVATGSQTYDVIIDEAVNEDLEQLLITQNQLQNIPKNVGNLKALTVLGLSNNKIESVDLGELHGLKKLSTVDLSNNRIYYIIPVGSLELNRLETLKLDNNFLTEIDFDGWIVPRLSTLTLTGNSLKFINNFDEDSFPSLQMYQDSSNLFDCRWRAGFVSMLQKWSTLNHNYYSNECTKSVQLSAATYRMLNIRDIRNYTFDFDNKEELQKQISSMIETEQKQSQQIEALNKLVKDQSDQLGEVSDKFETQQTAIDGMLAKIEELQKQLAGMTQLGVAAARNVPKDLRERLIQEVAEVIRRNLVEDDG